MGRRSKLTRSSEQTDITHQLESLEPRLLLTTIQGEDVFQFTDVDGQLVRVTAQGDLIAELIGAKTDGSSIILGDLPGEFVGGADADKAGVQVNLDPIDLIGDTPIDAADTTQGSISETPSPAINLNALASRPNGDTFSFNLTDVDVDGNTIPIVQLVQLDTDNGDGTVVARLEDVLPTESVDFNDPPTEDPADDTDISSVTAIRAAAFDPTNPEMLYFVVESGDNGIERLFRLDVTAGTSADIAASVEVAGGQFGEDSQTGDIRNIEDIEFDQTGPNPGDVRLFALLQEFEVTQGEGEGEGEGEDEGEGADATTRTPTQSAIVQVQFNADNFDGTGLGQATDTNTLTNRTNLTFANSPLSGIRGISLLEDNPAAEDDEFLLVQTDPDGPDGEASPRIFSVGGDGAASDLGSALDIDDNNAPVRGNDLQDLTFNPQVVDPFTGTLGAFLATDASSDELVIINTADRGINQLFAIYISQASDDASISVSTFHSAGNNSALSPFTGVSPINPSNGQNTIIESSDARFDLQVNNAQDFDTLNISFEQGIGGVYLGAKQFVKRTDNAEQTEPLRPVISASLNERIGVFAPGVDTFQDPGSLDNVGAGIDVSPNLLSFVSEEPAALDRLMGDNLDELSGIAIRRDITADDAIVVIDTDGLNQDGVPVDADEDQDELAWIDPATGKSTFQAPITDGVNPLSGAQALAFGDPSFSGAETLFAVYEIGGVATLGTIDTSTGVFSTIAPFSDAGLANAGVQSIAFAPTASNNTAAPQQAMYVVGNNGEFHEVSAAGADAGDTVAGGDTVRNGDGQVLQIGSVLFDRFGTRVMGHDLTFGRMVDIDLSTLGSGTLTAGESIATEAGSLRPSLAGIAYDQTNDRYLAADDSASQFELPNEDAFDEIFDLPITEESAALMVVEGVTGLSTALQINEADVSQDLGAALIGGKLTGHARFSGSVGTVYAGTILTGETSGQLEGPAVRTDNFEVGGDLRHLVTPSSLGTHEEPTSDEPVFMTGFDLQVGGQTQQIWTLGGAIGQFDFENDAALDGLTRPVREIEGREVFSGANNGEREWLGLNAGFPRLFDGTDRFFNDTFETAQGIGSLRNPVEGEVALANVTGVLNSTQTPQDVVDFFSIPLMAGQTVDIRLNPTQTSSLNPPILGVFDPDGRLIGTSLNTVNPAVTTFDPIRITADRPGEYRLATVTAAPEDGGALEFSNAAPTTALPITYGIDVFSADEMALGVFRSGGTVLSTAQFATTFEAGRGDLGALRSGGSFWFDTFSAAGQTAPDILSNNGNLRSFEAADDISRLEEGLFSLTPALEVRGGGIGLVRNSGDFIFRGFSQTFFHPNADNAGSDGVIDLIDVAGNFGTNAGGGPGINTGPGGDVRFMRVGGTILQDIQFFGGGFGPKSLDVGESFLHVDDGGGQVRITPGSAVSDGDGGDDPAPDDGDTPDDGNGDDGFGGGDDGADFAFRPAFDENDRNFAFTPDGSNGDDDDDDNGAGDDGTGDDGTGDDGTDGDTTAPTSRFLTVTQYGIRGSGGSVLVNLSVANANVSIESLDNGVNAPAQISRIVSEGANADVSITGPAQLDVLSIEGTDFDDVTNVTDGEIVSMTANSVDRIITTGRLGVPKSHTGALVRPIEVVTDVFPFEQQTTGINIAGDVNIIRADQGLGNLIIGGSVEQLRPNENASNDTGEFEGILAPVFIAGDLDDVNVGEGIAPSGSGLASQAGLYVQGAIGQVTNDPGGVIFGDVISLTSIGPINLTDGSLVNTQVAALTGLDQASAAGPLKAFTNTFNVTEVGPITLTGDGGIIGSAIQGGDIGDITVTNGFGVVNSFIESFGSAEIGTLTADGFGILGTNIQTASSMGDLIATGEGSPLAISEFDDLIRQSQFALSFHSEIDGLFLNSLTDLNQAFIASPTFELLEGQITDVQARGVIDLGDVRAYRINFSTIDFANSIRSITTLESVDDDPATINGLQVTTGKLDTFDAGADVRALDMTIAGPLGEVLIDGSLLDDSSIAAVGPNGVITRVDIAGDLDGSIFATNDITDIIVGGSVTGDITAEGGNLDAGNTVDTLTVGGDFTGSFNVLSGDVGDATVVGSVGFTDQPNDRFFIGGSINSLTIGDAATPDVSFLAADLIVLEDIGTLTLIGQTGSDVAFDPDGLIFVGGDLGEFSVAAHPNNVGDSLINLDVNIGGTLGAFNVTNGDIGDGSDAVSISVVGGIGPVLLTNGDLASNATLESTAGDIVSFTINTGSVHGNLRADKGEIGLVEVTGSELGGTISGVTAGEIAFDGSILATGAIDFAGRVEQIDIGDDVEAGGAINVGALAVLNVGDQMAGDLEVGYDDAPTVVTIGGDWITTDTTSIASDAAITVAGDLLKAAPAAQLHIGGDLSQLDVTGQGMADVLVDGRAGDVNFGSLDQAVFVAGHGGDAFTVAGAMSNALVQFGLSAGQDGEFAAITANKDAEETSRMADLDAFAAATMTDSILAVGGSIGTQTVTTMTNSSVSAGLVLGSFATRAVLNDPTRLNDAAERNAARSGADRALFHGDVSSATATNMVGSTITAGVDTAAGDFSDAGIGNSRTGGASVIGQFSGTMDAGSQLIADAGVTSNNATGAGAGNASSVNFTGGGDPQSDAEAFFSLNSGDIAGTAISGAPVDLVLPGGNVNVTISGPGQAIVYDTGGDNTLDAILLTGATSSTTVTITGLGAIDLGRLLTADDATARRVILDGDILGDGGAGVDVWVDGPMSELTMDDLGDNVSGQIGGDLGTLTIDNQGAGRLVLGGFAQNVSVATGEGFPIQTMLGEFAGTTFDSLAFDTAGNLWGHVGGGVLQQIDPSIDGPGGVIQTVNLTDAFSGDAPAILGMDFSGPMLFAVARLADPQPTELVGDINPGVGVDLRGLAVNSEGTVFAIDRTNGVDELVTMDRETGQLSVVGELRNPIGNSDFTQDVLTLAFGEGDRLLALVSDRDGNGPFDQDSDGVALVQIETTAVGGFVQVHGVDTPGQKGVLLDGGGVTADFKAMAVDTGLNGFDDGTIFAIRDNGGNDELVTIAEDGTVTSLGNVQIDGGGAGATNIAGMGLDRSGNLVAHDRNGRLVFLAPADLEANDATAFQELTEGSNLLAMGMDGFAIGGTGSEVRSFAFETDGDGTLFTNPFSSDDPDGRVLQLGTIDTATGAFQRQLTISNAAGTPVSLPAGQTSLPLAADPGSDAIFFGVDDGSGGVELIKFDTMTTMFSSVGTLTDSLGDPVSISAMDFNGEFVGIDLTAQRVVAIDPTSAEVAARTSAGVISADLTDLTHDPTTGPSGAFFSFRAGASDSFVQFRGATDQEAGGVIARGVNTLTVGSSYSQRVVTTGNTFDQVTLNGDFNGALISAGDITQLTQQGGVFGGVLDAAGDVGTLTFNGEVTADARILVGQTLATLQQNAGDFAGDLTATQVEQMTLAGSVLDEASLTISKALEQLTATGGFAGDLTADRITTEFAIDGQLGDGGSIDVAHDAALIEIDGGAHANSSVTVGGDLGSLDVGGTHAGVINVNGDLPTAAFEAITDGRLFVLGNTTDLSATGDVANALIVFGVDRGADGQYNTADDVIVGSSLTTGVFSGDFSDSVLAVAVLPAESAGPGAPASNQVFLQQASGDGSVVVNNVEAGGIRRGEIDSLTIANALNPLPGNPATQSVVVTSHGVEDLTVSEGELFLQVQTHNDPFGTPQVVEATQPSDSEIELVLSETINSDTVTLSQTLGDEGTVVVTQDGALVDGVTVRYSEREDAFGNPVGVITVTRNNGFSDEAPVRVDLVNTGTSFLFDRSGLRSSLRQIGDPLGTVFDGTANGEEGGDFESFFLQQDAAEEFISPPGPTEVPLEAGSRMLVIEDFSALFDTDIITFSGTAGQHFFVRYDGPSEATLGVFERDDQGTGTEFDDTFELVARWETNSQGELEDGNFDPDMSQAFELPSTGDFFIGLNPVPLGFAPGDFTLEMALADTKTELASLLGGTINADNEIALGANQTQEIAFVSNDQRPSKQLVFLNFDGGVSTETDLGEVTVDPFDLGVLDTALDGFESQLINGGDGVTGVLDNATTILTSFPAGVGSVDVNVLGADLSAFNAASTGVFFTTVDPSLSGLEAGEEFTTIFIGETDAGRANLFGLASNIDVAGQEVGDEAILFTENFANLSDADSVTERLNEFSRLVANVAVHELIHTLGINHQPTTGLDFRLDVDDPNNDGNTTDSNDGAFALMSLAPASVLLTELGELGTADLSPLEFNLGQIDTATMFVRWFS